MLVIFSVAFPLLVMVTVCGTEVVPVCCETKVRGVEESVTAGAGTTSPIADSGTVCGESLALSVKVILADLAPVAEGVKTIPELQLAPPASVPPQPLVKTKFAALVPVTVIEVIVSEAVPIFDRVVLCEAVGLPTVIEPKVKLV